MTMPDPRGSAQMQFPPPGFTQAAPAQVLDPNAPGYNPVAYPPAHAGNPGREPATWQGDGDYETEQYGDYYGSDRKFKYIFDDGKTWVEFKEMTEGDIARYQKILNRDIVVEKQTGNARITVDQVQERHALLMVAVTGWNMRRKHAASGQYLPQTFSNGSLGSEFMKWVHQARPQIVIDIAEAIRKENPFIVGTGQETVEAIDKQIDELMEQRRQIVERQQGEGASANS